MKTVRSNSPEALRSWENFCDNIKLFGKHLLLEGKAGMTVHHHLELTVQVYDEYEQQQDKKELN